MAVSISKCSTMESGNPLPLGRVLACAQCASARWSSAEAALLNEDRWRAPAYMRACRWQRRWWMDPLRVLIADDHPMFRQGLRTVFDAQQSIQIIGEATTGEEAISLCEQLEPDLVLMDIRMPGINGIEA